MAGEKREKTKREIVQAAIECINEESLKNATIRKIADKAGVNSAAISYYFGSREELINQALEVTLDNAFDFDDFIYKKTDDYKTVLKTILEHWKPGVANYPGIFQAHFGGLMDGIETNEITVKRINLFFDNVYGILTEHGLEDNDKNYKRLRLIFVAFVSKFLMPEVAYPKGSEDEIDILVDML
jgi:AcrR family transcriptional regulator